MSKLSHIYPDFNARVAQENDPENEDGFAEQKLGAFEDGYQAGWADAVQATESEEAAILTELKQSLQDSTFTYQEALGKLCSAIQPLLKEITKKVLPRTLDASIPLHLSENLESLLKNQLSESAMITMSPKTKQLVETKLDASDLNVPLTLVADSAIGDGQLMFNVPPSELEVDFDELLSGINRAIEAHFTT